MKTMKTKHLDIGCGSKPRNPFNQDELYGTDIIEQTSDKFNYIQSNVVIEKLPFDDDTFDSVSAYDFLEHIPRLVIDNNISRFPFIEMMNESYRVLKPNGVFYALTPCYPRAELFVDPTHVNFISRKTHKYFTLPKLGAKMYGFNGKFKIKRVGRVKFTQEIKQSNAVIKFLKNIFYTIYYTKKSHIVWEFQAIK
jgi:SAM-dependent methyltransferase